MGVAYPDTAQIGLARLHPVIYYLLYLHGGEDGFASNFS